MLISAVHILTLNSQFLSICDIHYILCVRKTGAIFPRGVTEDKSMIPARCSRTVTSRGFYTARRYAFVNIHFGRFIIHLNFVQDNRKNSEI